MPDFKNSPPDGKPDSRVAPQVSTARSPLALARISPYTHDMPTDRVFKHLFGEEPVIDEHTGMVHNLRGR